MDECENNKKIIMKKKKEGKQVSNVTLCDEFSITLYARQFNDVNKLMKSSRKSLKFHEKLRTYSHQQCLNFQLN